MSEFEWECPKCGQHVYGQGPASLRWAQQNHAYWEHERKAQNVAMPGGGAILRAPLVPDVLVGGLAALDDAYYDGARLTVFDLNFLKTRRVDWKTKDCRP